MMDTYQVEYYTKDGRRVGVQISAYSSYDAERYAQQMPDYNYLASFPEKVRSGNDNPW